MQAPDLSSDARRLQAQVKFTSSRPAIRWLRHGQDADGAAQLIQLARPAIASVWGKAVCYITDTSTGRASATRPSSSSAAAPTS